MELAHVADRCLVIDDIRLPPGMEEGTVAVRRVMHLLVHADLIQELFHHALHGEEVALPVHPQGELHPLVGKLGQWQGLGQIDISHLVQLHGLVPAVIV